MNLQKLKAKIAEAQNMGKNTAIGIGGGCYLQIRGPHLSWLFKNRHSGKAKSVGLGGFDEVSMAEAVRRAADNAGLVRHGHDPKELRTERVANAAAAARQSVTFKEATRQFVATGALNGFASRKHRHQWEQTLSLTDGTLGRLAVSKIETSDVAAALLPLWNSKRSTAMRLRGRIERVLSFSTVKKYRTGENPAKLALVRELLPKDKAPPIRHHAALPWQQVPAFMAALHQRGGMVARALELIVLCASRRSEIEGLRWSEIDFAKATLTIPASRMKMRKEHIIPLSSRAIEILRSLRPGNADDTKLVFEGESPGRPYGPQRLNDLLAEIESGVTAHGFRSAFRDWCEESGEHFGAAEACLAHRKGGTVGAYLRTTFFDRRVGIMQRWADFCERGTADNVRRLHDAAAA